MTRERRVPDAVQWHEGMLLAPQHFQQFAVRGEALLQYHVQALAPYAWGVRVLRIDPVALLDGTYRVLELEAVMPDGLVVAAEAGEGAELTVSLRDAAASATGPLTVQLVVPARRAHGGDAGGGLARYTSYEGSPVPDLNTGEGELAIPRLRPRAALVVADAVPDKYVNLPLAQVAYRDETFAATDFVPPLLEVAPQTDLGRLCAAVVQRTREKAVFLADRARATPATDRSAMLLETQLMAQSLAAGLPPVEAMLRTGVTHPYPMYLALCGMVGLAAAAGRGIVPPVFATYDHADLRGTFAQVVDFMNGLLDGIQELWRAVVFHDANGVFELTMDASWLAGGVLTLGVVAPAGGTEADAAAWMQNALVASKGRMSTLRERRIRGPERARLPAPDAIGIAPRRGELVFTVDVDARYIGAGEPLQILHQIEAGSGRPREVVLYAPNRP